MFNQKVLLGTILTTAGIAFASAAQAAPGTFGSAESTWINPAPAGNVDAINIDIFGYNTVTWGTIIPSGLGFKSEEDVSFQFGETFKVGKLGFFNTLDLDSDVLESVDLKLDLNFDIPEFTQMVTFNLDIETTPDNLFFCGVFGFCNPDSVAIAPPVIQEIVKAANGHKYQVDLMFDRNPLVANELNLADFKDFKIDAFQTSHLKATVTKVPEPASIIGLLSVGALMAGSALKKKETV